MISEEVFNKYYEKAIIALPPIIINHGTDYESHYRSRKDIMYWIIAHLTFEEFSSSLDFIKKD